MANELKIEYVPISEVVPFSGNPRKNDRAVAIVKKSLEKYGFKVPIILGKDNVIIAGHTRIKAALELGYKEVPVIWADDLTDAEQKAFRIMENKSNEYAAWNMELLKTELTELKNLDFNLELTGFNFAELDKIVPSEIKEDIIDVNAYERAKAKTKIQSGDVFQLGEHRLMCGDCTVKENVDKLMNGQKADMVLTDPPYGVDYSEKNTFLNAIARGNRNQTPIEGDKELNIFQLISDFLSMAQMAEKNTIYVFSRGKHIADMIYAFNDADCYYSQDLKWVKNNHVLGRLDYMPKSENILYGWKGKHEFYGGFQTDVLNFDKPLQSKEHPTMKPVELLSTLIKQGSKENMAVYDGFGGSGSTLIACEQLNRKCFMMEIDPVYCQIIIERWENLTKNKAIKL